MTREALAAESGVSPSYLYEVERGYKRPSTDVLARLAEALGRSPSEVLAYIEAMSEVLPAATPEARPGATAETPPGLESAPGLEDLARNMTLEPDLPGAAAMRIEPPRMEPPRTRREWASSRFNIDPAIDAYETPTRQSGSLRSLLAVLEYLGEDDIRILLALARRLAGRGG